MTADSKIKPSNEAFTTDKNLSDTKTRSGDITQVERRASRSSCLPRRAKGAKGDSSPCRPVDNRESSPIVGNPTFVGREATPTAAERAATAHEPATLSPPRSPRDLDRAPTASARTVTVRRSSQNGMHRPTTGGSVACPKAHRTATARETTLAFDPCPPTGGKRQKHIHSLALSLDERTSTVSHRTPTRWKSAPLDAPRIQIVCQRIPTD